LPWLGAGVSWWWSKRKRRVWVGLGVAMNVALVGVMVVAPRVFFGMVEWLPGMKAEAGQVKGWVSGYGVREVVEDIRGLARQGPIVVLVRVDSGNPEDAVLLWLRSEKNVLAVYDWEYVGSEMDQADRLPVYFVSRDGNLGMLEDELMELVKRYDKPGESGGYVGLWKREKRIEPE